MNEFIWRFDFDHYFQPVEGFYLRNELSLVVWLCT